MWLFYLAMALLGAHVVRGLWVLCVQDDEPFQRVASLLVILLYLAAIYGVLTK